MITEFYGELLISPLPMELSLNYCSHKCAYCFANLNKPDRQAKTRELFTQLKNYPTQSNFAAHLLREKYPVMISNKVDPFATSNYQITLPVLEQLTAMDIPVALQTRGGKGIDEALQIIKAPSLWYVSISQTDEAIRKAVEPGGSSLDERWELVDRLHEAGHNVVLGINPLVPEWIDLDILFDKLRKHKIKNVWIGRLHLNNDQVKNMTEKEKVAIGDVLLQRARRRGLDGIDLAIHTEFINMAASEGVHVYHTGGSHRTDFFELYHQTYPGKTFPVMQDFVNHCWDTKADGDFVRFSEFAQMALPKLPAGEWNMRGYVTSQYRIYKEAKLPSKFSFAQLLAMFWNDLKIKKHMATFPNFAFAVYEDEDGSLDYVYDKNDEQSMLLKFSPYGFEFQESNIN